MSGDFLERVIKDFDRLDEIGFVDDQRRGEADDGVMGLFGQNPSPQHGKTDVRCLDARGIEFDPGPKPFASHIDDCRMAGACEPAQ